jgi:hypothetical protein
MLKIDHQQLQFSSEIAVIEYIDYKSKIHPKEKFNADDGHFIVKSYNQAFAERYGFLPNLSIIDLIFNEGPGAGDVLRGSVL